MNKYGSIMSETVKGRVEPKTVKWTISDSLKHPHKKESTSKWLVKTQDRIEIARKKAKMVNLNLVKDVYSCRC